MGNDLLIGRLDLTPVLDAHVCPLYPLDPCELLDDHIP
jgi:hypothetical protein